MKQSVFAINKMDCPTEEQLIRNRLKSVEGIEELGFNLLERELTVIHVLADDRGILAALESLGMEPARKSGPLEAGMPEAWMSEAEMKASTFSVPGMC